MNAMTPGGRPSSSSETTRMAMTETVLSPRFYTTDFAAMDAISVDAVREQWDRLMAEFHADPNKGHFIRTEEFDAFALGYPVPPMPGERVPERAPASTVPAGRDEEDRDA